MIALLGITKIFGGSARDAMDRLDRGEDREAIREATGSVVAVADVSLEVHKGEILVVMGLSGCGKSTLLRCINGLVRPERGRVLLGEGNEAFDLVAASKEVLRQVRLTRISMVFQQHSLLGWRTVRENVALGLELRGVSEIEVRRIVDETLERVGLGPWGARYPDELSGGMQQRVGLARALATDAEVLLLDEPLGSLDPLLRARMQDEILALQRDLQKTMVLVTHDMEEALRLGSRIAILEAGRVAQIGSPGEIVASPATPSIRQFVAHVNPLRGMRAASLMRPAASLPREEDGLVRLDRAGLWQCRIDADGRPLSVRLDRNEGRLVHCDESGAPTGLTERDIAAGRPEMDIRTIFRVCHATGRPMALLDGDGRLTGVIEEREIVSALLGSERGD